MVNSHSIVHSELADFSVVYSETRVVDENVDAGEIILDIIGELFN